MIRALGILYFKVTGPFWNMLHDGVEYVDQYLSCLYVKKMHNCFLRWSDDSTELLNPQTTMFPEFMIENTEPAHSVFCTGQSEEEMTKRILCSIMKGFVSVTERQLKAKLNAK